MPDIAPVFLSIMVQKQSMVLPFSFPRALAHHLALAVVAFDVSAPAILYTHTIVPVLPIRIAIHLPS